MNPKIIDSAEKNADIFFFMAQIISNYLLEKYKIMVAEDSKSSFIKKSRRLISSIRGIMWRYRGLRPRKVPRLRKCPSRSPSNRRSPRRGC